MSPVVIKTGPQSPPAPPSRSFDSSPSSGNLPDNEDFFSVGQAFQDWFQLLVSPRSFCEDQEGASGMLSPLVLTLAYSLLFGVFYLALLCGYGTRMGMYGIIALFLVVLIVPATWLGYIVFSLIWGGLLHLTSLIFGGRGTYSGSFRAAVYSFAPLAALYMVAGMLTLVFLPPWEHSRADGNIFQVGANLAGLLWGGILVSMSLRATQRLSVGGAIATALIGFGLLAGLGTLIGEALYMLRSAS